MAVVDLWVRRDGSRSPRYGRGKRWRVTHPRFASRAFDDKREADLYWADVLQADRVPAKPDDKTVGALLDLWLATKRGLSPRGQEACRDAAVRVKAQWGSVACRDIRPTVAQTWIAGLEVQDVHGLGMVPASESTRRKTLQALSGALAIAVESGLIAKNPAVGVRVAKTPPKARRYLRPYELQALAKASGDYELMVLVMGTTGLRIGEACALNVGDVLTDRRRLYVRQSKNGDAREVPIASHLLDELDLDRAPSRPLFEAPQGGRLSVHNWRSRVFYPARDASVGEPMTPHDLRHTAASIAIAAGADIKAVQRMLGHKSATMTWDLYSHLWDEKLDDVADRIGSMFTGASPKSS